MATYTDPNTGVLYPSYEWYQEKVNPESGQLISSETLEGKPELPKEEPPIVGGDDFNEFKESVGETPNSTGWQGYIDKQNALMDSQQAAIDEEKKRLETQKTEAAETKSSFDTLMDKWLNRQTTEEKTTQEYGELGVDPAQYLAERKADIAELSGLWDEYNKMVTMKDTDIAQIESQAMAMPYMEGKKIAAEKKWNIKLNAMAAGMNTKMAIMEMKTGTMDEARKFVNEAVENFVYDKKLDFQDLTTFKEMYEDQLAGMDATYTNILNATIDKAELEYTLAKNDADQIGQLILDTSGQAGIDFDDTLQEAIQKASNWQASQLGTTSTDLSALLSPAEAKALGVPYGTTKGQAAAMGITPGAGEALENIDYLTDQIVNRKLDINSSALSREQKAAILNNMAQKGLSVPRTLTGAEKTAQSNAIAGLTAVDDIDAMLQEDPSLLWKALAPDFLAGWTGSASFKAARKTAQDVITRLRTGAALNESEIAFYNSMVPKVGDNSNSIQYKLVQLRALYLGTSGLPVTVVSPEGAEYIFQDLYDSSQRKGLRDAIDNGYKLIY